MGSDFQTHNRQRPRRFFWRFHYPLADIARESAPWTSVRFNLWHPRCAQQFAESDSCCRVVVWEDSKMGFSCYSLRLCQSFDPQRRGGNTRQNLAAELVPNKIQCSSVGFTCQLSSDRRACGVRPACMYFLRGRDLSVG